ncbi:glycoside hydrolase family 5 protein [Nonomuraea salmonea]|uniref:glycoside hydrolase family 5 protein n=1 Tax=Nonomuraea salmonea TaxID=46181 RepID=UPI002FE83B64
MHDESARLHIDGDRLVTASGETVRLRGVGLGGWMNMENFITGYPSTEELQRAALRRVLGQDVYDAFFERFLEVFFTDDDARFLADLGMNSVRVPFNYRHFEDDDRPMRLKEEGFLLLDRVIETCARHGLYTVLDLHAAPGYHNQRWHSDNPTHRSLFWTHRHFQDRVVHLWEALADRYKDNPWVAGYNPLNEPADPSGERIGPFYERLHAAIRAVDPSHVLFLDGNRHATDFELFADPLPGTVYTVHDYALAGFADSGDYPGLSRGRHVDRDYLEARFLERAEYMRRTGTPIWVGEFGPVYSTPYGGRPGARRRPLPRAGRPARHLRRVRGRLEPVDVQGHRVAGRRSRRRGLAVPAQDRARPGEEGPAGRGRVGRRGHRRPAPAGADRADRGRGVPGFRPAAVRPAAVDPRAGAAHPAGRAHGGRVRRALRRHRRGTGQGAGGLVPVRPLRRTGPPSPRR